MLDEPLVYFIVMPPKVSTILCCYNQAEYVAQAMESVLHQTHSNVELVAIDNGSTDGSQEAMRRFADDPRVSLLLHGANGPISRRMNEGIARSTGDFVSILYADDYYLPEKFQRQLAAFDGLGPEFGVVYSPGMRVNVDTGERWTAPSMTRSGDLLAAMMTEYYSRGFINPISPLIRREVAERYKFREEIFTEGEIVYFRYALAYKFFFIDEALVVMRDRPDNIGKAIKKNMTHFMRCMDLLSREPEFPGVLLDRLARFRSDLLRNYGWQGLRMAEDPIWARQCFVRAVDGDRTQWAHLKIPMGLCLSYLPRPILRGLNAAADAFSGSKAHGGFREDYV